jgi:hypothetical protein
MSLEILFHCPSTRLGYFGGQDGKQARPFHLSDKPSLVEGGLSNLQLDDRPSSTSIHPAL